MLHGPKSVFENCPAHPRSGEFSRASVAADAEIEISLCTEFKQTTTDATDESNDEIRMSNDELMTKREMARGASLQSAEGE